MTLAKETGGHLRRGFDSGKAAIARGGDGVCLALRKTVG
jgi:hypothetical protein